MNFEKFLATRAVTQPAQTGSRSLQWEEHLAVATRLRNEIVEANLRLAVSIAVNFVDRQHSIEESVAAASIPLIRAVELFDVSRGLCFSTYASHALRNHFRRQRQQSERWRRRHVTPDRRLNEIRDDHDHPAIQQRQFTERQAMAHELLDQLEPRDREILKSRFGLNDSEHGATFHEVAHQMGLSKERIRVLTHRALAQLREACPMTHDP